MATTEAVEAPAVTDETEEIPEEIQALNRRLAYLEGINREYQVTIKVVAVLAERLLTATEGESIVITDKALAESPDLKAWREASKRQVVIQVSR